ncbi:hypothetical protein J437_LFUL006683 [Ladona fulva]|uniref:furin n=1 Tax=Ladona fulva TaxID=123851 RepID=A0A8K0NXF9_LADFU|nr:hypothetical protein J437_LFUL006683 [Ladona fulva]
MRGKVVETPRRMANYFKTEDRKTKGRRIGDHLASTDINDNDDDPMPRDNGDNKHGTRCAGEVASVAFNDYCGIGVAYNASIGGVRMLDGTVNDAVEARALGLNPEHIDIYSASWGPEDDGKTVDGPGPLARRAFIYGVTSGRKGKGSIFVWASGNGGRHTDSCNCDGYTNSIFTLSISSATQGGYKPWYLEECSSTLATTYSSGTPGHDKSVATVDMDPKLRPDRICTVEHTGTSASAPLAAGICALALEANPELTWRDMQYLVVLTSRPGPLEKESGWIVNGVKRKVSHKFGYGLMDAGAMVTLAEQWTTAPPQHICKSQEINEEKEIQSIYGATLTVHMDVDGCHGTYNDVRFLEHVQCKLSLRFFPRGNLRIALTSPMGTTSTLLFERPRDILSSNFDDWPFLSVHFWGERADGRWTLQILNAGSRHVNQHGKSFPYHGDTCWPCHESCETCAGAGQDSCLTCAPAHLRVLDLAVCLQQCPESYYEDTDASICVPCESNCGSCQDKPDHCTSCDHHLVLYNNKCYAACPMYTYETEDYRLIFIGILKKWQLIFYGTATDPIRLKGGAGGRQSNQPLLSVAFPTAPSAPLAQGSSILFSGTPATSFAGTFHGYSNVYDVAGSDKVEVSASASNGNALENGASEGGGLDGRRILYDCDPECDSQGCYGKGPSQCIGCKHYKLDGYYSDRGICAKCYLSCMTCSGPRRDQCVVCPKGWQLAAGECHPECPGGFFKGEFGCQKCHHFCRFCKGEGPLECTSCPPQFMLEGGLCMECLSSQYYDPPTQLCRPCHPTCRTCTGPGPYSCKTCTFPLHLERLDNQCVPCCSEGVSPPDCCQCEQETGECLNSSPGGKRRTAAAADGGEASPVVGAQDSSTLRLAPFTTVTALAIGGCATVVVLFGLIFAVLQVHSNCNSCWKQGYEKLPTRSRNVRTEKISLAEDEEIVSDQDDDEEQLFTKT